MQTISKEERITLRIQELNSTLETVDATSLVGSRISGSISREIEFLESLIDSKELLEDSKKSLRHSKLLKNIVNDITK